MLYLGALLVCSIVPALFLETLILKATALVFRKGSLSWGTALIATLVAAPFSISASILRGLNSGNVLVVAAELLSVLGVFLLPVIIIKRSLRIGTFISIAIIVVATIASTIAGVGYGLGIRAVVFQAFRIPSSAMSPTLVKGDYMLVNKLVYMVGRPSRGEVAVFQYPVDTSKDFIQRIVAVGGDTVEIRGKQLLVNGKPLDKDPGVNLSAEIVPAASGPRDNLPVLIVPPGCFFVLGDNRDHSYDSRFWGLVKLEHMVGRASVIYWSYDTEQKRIRTERIGARIR